MGIELTVLAIRGITLECPSCGAGHRTGLSRCSGGGLRCGPQAACAGPLRVLFQVCQCGRVLPTLLGKLRLASQCPHCGCKLPGRICSYSVPTLHIPVAGSAQVTAQVRLHVRQRQAALRRHQRRRGQSNTLLGRRRLQGAFLQAKTWRSRRNAQDDGLRDLVPQHLSVPERGGGWSISMTAPERSAATQGAVPADFLVHQRGRSVR